MIPFLLLLASSQPVELDVKPLPVTKASNLALNFAAHHGLEFVASEDRLQTDSMDLSDDQMLVQQFRPDQTWSMDGKTLCLQTSSTPELFRRLTDVEWPIFRAFHDLYRVPQSSVGSRYAVGQVGNEPRAESMPLLRNIFGDKVSDWPSDISTRTMDFPVRASFLVTDLSAQASESVEAIASPQDSGTVVSSIPKDDSIETIRIKSLQPIAERLKQRIGPLRGRYRLSDLVSSISRSSGAKFYLDHRFADRVVVLGLQSSCSEQQLLGYLLTSCDLFVRTDTGLTYIGTSPGDNWAFHDFKTKVETANFVRDFLPMLYTDHVIPGWVPWQAFFDKIRLNDPGTKAAVVAGLNPVQAHRLKSVEAGNLAKVEVSLQLSLSFVVRGPYGETGRGGTFP